MLEAMAKMWPWYAFWLVTGITDATNGHVAPETAQTFPERVYDPSDETQQYFRAQLDLAQKLCIDAEINMDDERERMLATERTNPLSHWVSGEITGVAYQMARSDEYANIRALWSQREAQRKQLIVLMANADQLAAEPDKALINEKSALRIGFDAISRHQSRWELFYRPKDPARTRFALTFMNNAPKDLTEEDVLKLTTRPPEEVRAYLEIQDIDPDTVFETGQVMYRNTHMSEDEVIRLRNALSTLRKPS